MVKLSDEEWFKENRIVDEYKTLVDTKLKLIPEIVIYTSSKEKSEKLVKKHFEKRGYLVFNGTIHGYRVIGWPGYWDSLKTREKRALDTIKSILPSEDFEKLAKMIVDKNGCPDLMIIKDKKIEFVEVKSNNETVKPVTVEFFIKLKEKYPISIVRVIKKKNKRS